MDLKDQIINILIGFPCRADSFSNTSTAASHRYMKLEKNTNFGGEEIRFFKLLMLLYEN
jgi:hypothetical protein